MGIAVTLVALVSAHCVYARDLGFIVVSVGRRQVVERHVRECGLTHTTHQTRRASLSMSFFYDFVEDKWFSIDNR